jgi:uncharacterized protein (DUF2342 family)
MLSLTQAMLSMAKEYVVPPAKEEVKEDIAKAVHYPAGSTLQGAAPEAKGRKTSMIIQEEANVNDLAAGNTEAYVKPKKKVRHVMASQVMNPQTGKPISTLEQESVSQQGNVGFSPYVKG